MTARDTKNEATSGALRAQLTLRSACSRKKPEMMPVKNATMQPSQVPTMSMANPKDNAMTPKIRSRGEYTGPVAATSFR